MGHPKIDPGSGERTVILLVTADGRRWPCEDAGEVEGAKAVAVGRSTWEAMRHAYPRITCREVPGLLLEILLIEPGLVAFPSFKGSLVPVPDPVERRP